MATKKRNLTEASEAITSRLFTGTATEAPERPLRGRQADGVNNVSTERENAVRGRKKSNSEPVKVFSFRAAVNDVDKWRLYAAIRGVKVDEIGAAAMREYLRKHPLSQEEQALFDKRIESMNS